MKELGIEEKAKRYHEALEAAVVAHKDEDKHLKATLERIFPELKESEDERIRKTLIELIKCNERSGYNSINNIETSSILAWLEKQGEKKPYEWHSEDEQNLNDALTYIDDKYLRKWLKYIIHCYV